MIDRATIKQNAKSVLRNYYWLAVVASLIVTVITELFSGSSRNANNTTVENGLSFTEIYNFLGGFKPFVFTVTTIGMVLLLLVAGMILSSIIVNVITVGFKSFFLKNKKENTGLGELFAYFNSATYKNTAITMFLMNLFVFLWALLLVIPGIVKGYEYYFVPYILAENPNMEWRDVLASSRNMTDGIKGDLFIFDLSFLGWNLLGRLIPLGLGPVLVNPYVEASKAELYDSLKPGITVENTGYYA